jgi:hypothetical protein
MKRDSFSLGIIEMLSSRAAQTVLRATSPTEGFREMANRLQYGQS